MWSPDFGRDGIAPREIGFLSGKKGTAEYGNVKGGERLESLNCSSNRVALTEGQGNGQICQQRYKGILYIKTLSPPCGPLSVFSSSSLSTLVSGHISLDRPLERVFGACIRLL